MKIFKLTFLMLIAMTLSSFANTCKTAADCSGGMKCCYTNPLPSTLENPKEQKGYCTYDTQNCKEVK